MAARRFEVEWQFDVRDLDALGRWIVRAPLADAWTVTADRTLDLRDAYFDTDAWHVMRAGYALRIRRSGAAVEATLKALRRGRKGGVSRRREVTQRLGDARVESLRGSRGRVATRIARIVGAHALRRLFALRTRRRTFVVRHRGRAVAELALDRTAVTARGRTRRLERIEIEVVAGAPVTVAGFVATLRRHRHLKATRRSKFEMGLAAAGHVTPRRC
jgi:inorganic triphosphatase YgiF